MERCSAAAGCLAGEGAGEAMAAMAMLCSLDCCCAVLCCVVLFCCGGWRAVVVRYVWLLVLVLVVWWAGLLPAAGCCTATTPRLHRTHLGLYSYVRASPPYIHLHTPTRTYYTHAAHLALPNRRATFKKKHPPPPACRSLSPSPPREAAQLLFARHGRQQPARWSSRSHQVPPPLLPWPIHQPVPVPVRRIVRPTAGLVSAMSGANKSLCRSHFASHPVAASPTQACYTSAYHTYMYMRRHARTHGRIRWTLALVTPPTCLHPRPSLTHAPTCVAYTHPYSTHKPLPTGRGLLAARHKQANQPTRPHTPTPNTAMHAIAFHGLPLLTMALVLPRNASSPLARATGPISAASPPLRPQRASCLDRP